MNLLKSFGNSLKDNFKSDVSTKPRAKTIVEPQTAPKSPLTRATRTQSLSQISALHSHRNMKISLQIQLAESMFDPNQKLLLNSKLCPDFHECLNQHNLTFPFFLQFVDSLESSKQNLIKSFLQAKCLVDYNKIALNSDEKLSEKQFYNDFEQIFRTMENISNNLDFNLNSCKDYESLSEFYDHLHESDHEYDEHSSSGLKLFELFVEQVEHELGEKFHSHFLCSKYFRMLEYEVLCDNSSLQLADILYASTPIASTFLEFMDQEGLRRFVEFLIMHRNFEEYSGQLSDALAIYDRFFNLGNKCSSTIVELSDKSYKNIEDSLQGSSFTPNCFDQIASIFTQYFSKTYFPQFIQNELFIDYLKSCEDSFKLFKNNSKNKVKKQTSVDSCQTVSSIDSGLWKRNDREMNLTFIDNYGRINSLFKRDVTETSGQQNSGGKLSQVIKKLTLKDEEEEKRKEEDAWRIAQSIINDVCSVTSTSQTSFQNC